MVMCHSEALDQFFTCQDIANIFIRKENQNDIDNIIDCIYNGKKLFIISGVPGIGKTILFRNIVYNLADDVCIVKLNTSIYGLNEIINNIGVQLDLSFSTKSPLNIKIKEIKNLFVELITTHVIIEIDQAHNIPLSILKSLLPLFNIKCSKKKYIHIFLIESEGIQGKIMESVANIIDPTNIYCATVESLSADDVREYIDFHQKQSIFVNQNLFTGAAINRLSYYSQGVPRIINHIGGMALYMAYLEKEKIVNAKMIDEVSKSCLMVDSKNEIIKKTLRTIVTENVPLNDKYGLTFFPIENDNNLDQYVNNTKKEENGKDNLMNNDNQVEEDKKEDSIYNKTIVNNLTWIDNIKKMCVKGINKNSIIIAFIIIVMFYLLLTFGKSVFMHNVGIRYIKIFTSTIIKQHI